MQTTHGWSWAPTLIKFMANRWCFPKLMIRVHFFNKWYSLFINQVSHNHHIDHKNIYAKLQSIKLVLHIWNNEHEILATSPESYITCHKLHFTARFDSRKNNTEFARAYQSAFPTGLARQLSSNTEKFWMVLIILMEETIICQRLEEYQA